MTAVPSISFDQLVKELREEQRKDEEFLATLTPEQLKIELAKRDKEHAEAVKLAESLGLKIL